MELPGVRGASARLSFAGLLGNGARELPVLGEGIEPEGERPMMRSITLLQGKPLSPQDVSGAWLGEGLAATLKAAPGDTLTLVASTLDGAMNTLDIQVTGIFRSFSQDYDARALKLNLPAAQELLGTEEANTVVVLLEDEADVASSARLMLPVVQKRGLAVRTWQELNDFYRNTVLLYDRQFAVLSAIILLMIALGVNNAVNMAVLERRAEFGTMRALGNRDAHIFRLVVAEVSVLALFGSLLGVTLGVLLSHAISAVGIDMPPPPNSNLGYVARIKLVPDVIAQAFAVGVISTLLAGIVPAWKMARTPIVGAIADAR
jgi:putative ABC transport system permease protein